MYTVQSYQHAKGVWSLYKILYKISKRVYDRKFQGVLKPETRFKTSSEMFRYS